MAKRWTPEEAKTGLVYDHVERRYLEGQYRVVDAVPGVTLGETTLEDGVVVSILTVNDRVYTPIDWQGTRPQYVREAKDWTWVSPMGNVVKPRL